MTSPFSSIVRHEAPAHYVWEDEIAIAFLDTHPHTDGHTLVIPRREEDRWTDLTDDENERMFWVAKQIGRAQLSAFDCTRAGLVIAGYHVPHVHIHVFPTKSMADFDFTDLPPAGSPDDLNQNAARLRSALIRDGLGEHVPALN